MGSEKISLSHPDVRRVRRRFEQQQRGRRTKCNLGYAELWDLFSDSSKSFTSIGDEAGITKQRVSEIFKRYFAEFLIGKGGNQRSKARHLKNHCAAARTFPPDTVIGKVADLALQNHCLALRMPARQWKVALQTMFLKNALIINSQRCMIYNPRNVFLPNKESAYAYAHVEVLRRKLSDYDFVVIYTKPVGRAERVFIIPCEEVRKVSRTGSSRGVPLYIPLERIRSSTLRPKIDYWRYENAWHLLTIR